MIRHEFALILITLFITFGDVGRGTTRAAQQLNKSSRSEDQVGATCVLSRTPNATRGTVYTTRFDNEKLVKSLILLEEWKSVSIVYQDDDNSTRSLKRSLSEIGVLGSFFDINDIKNSSKLFSVTSPVPIFLLCSDMRCIKRIILQECHTRKRLPLEPQLYWLLVWPELANVPQLWSWMSCCVTHLAIVVRKELDSVTSVYSLLHTGEGERRLHEAVTINSDNDITQFQHIFPGKHGFNHEHFTAATLQVKPFMYKEDGKYVGFLVDILNFVSYSLNFTYTLIEPPDGKYGSIENGTWNGLVGTIVRKDADMIMADISTTHLRSQVVDFSYPYNFDVATVVVKRAADDSSSYLSYIQLYRWEVHVCIWSSLILAFLFIKFIEWVNPFYRERRVAGKGDHSTSIFHLFGALLKQGGRPIIAASQSRRLFLGTWWIFAIIMATIYSGNLIAFLTVRKLKLPFDTIAEMVSQDQYKWGTYGGSNYIEFFETSKDENFKKVAEGFKRFPKEDPSTLSTKAEEHRLKVLKGNYCFIGGKPTLEFWVSQNCQLKLLSEGFYSLLYGISLPKNSPYTKLFSDEIISLHETGIMAMMKAKWWPRNQCNNDNRKFAKPIHLTDIQSAFYVLVIGALLTIVILVLEVIYAKIKTHCHCCST
ncbi:glutamate receptor ionotropic, kainate 2-like isoform X2 [Gigantopelta aegis]|uniref:glutamate receptor ionotropic, kainate 2-like isoform X2 n=1 Tax=Gigantopelta aegis TaxID=1735272 RepID=UPI001B88C021|nr:glutamate receptor ionotropic, kainate 2-like isoform X2 [Gigantopelta aegis]